jgi:hypothetical protein
MRIEYVGTRSRLDTTRLRLSLWRYPTCRCTAHRHLGSDTPLGHPHLLPRRSPVPRLSRALRPSPRIVPQCPPDRPSSIQQPPSHFHRRPPRNARPDAHRAIEPTRTGVHHRLEAPRRRPVALLEVAHHQRHPRVRSPPPPTLPCPTDPTPQILCRSLSLHRLPQRLS